MQVINNKFLLFPTTVLVIDNPSTFQDFLSFSRCISIPFKKVSQVTELDVCHSQNKRDYQISNTEDMAKNTNSQFSAKLCFALVKEEYGGWGMGGKGNLLHKVFFLCTIMWLFTKAHLNSHKDLLYCVKTVYVSLK